MFRGAVIAGLLALGAFQPVFGENIKFKVTRSKDYNLGLTIFGGPMLLLDACWASAKADLDWLITCDYGDDGILVAAVGNSDEEKCEDIQFGIFGGQDGIECVATLFSAGGTGKGNGSFRFTGSERSTRASVRAARVPIEKLPQFQQAIEEYKATRGRLKQAN